MGPQYPLPWWTPDTILGGYYNQHSKLNFICASHINTALKEKVTTLNLHTSGITAEDVSSHSLRAGGAMAMHLNGASSETIQKMGHWSSDTFLQYIHNQIDKFAAVRLSTKMAQDIPFHNIAEPMKAPTILTTTPYQSI